MMREGSPQTLRLVDYQPPAFLIDRVELEIELGDSGTRVTSTLHLRRRPGARQDAPLVLDGEGLELHELRFDGYAMRPSEYEQQPAALIVPGLPQSCALTTVSTIHPEANTALEGLYRSGGMYCTQCEAEGFRRITWFLDRPDVLARYRTRIVADRARYPVLLSNGNPVEAGELDEGRHFAVYDDPWPKPSYLFALVAGDLACVSDAFMTRSGRGVALRLYTEHGNEDRCAHALDSLKRAMRWDEERYGREYDLDLYNIVAVSDFNMGAMENKGLNIFNAKYVLARPDTATDLDYQYIEGVIAHEYFHNWSGNRVTCRDWFQLSLKEGLTVFRDQQFSADMGSPTVKRIADVRVLRSHQFAEDGGPMAHPVRPAEYIEINNFYTLTVYNKGAEVIRMMHTLLGEAQYRKGTDLYFDRHDGQAVTVEDFVAAMEAASGRDLGQFSRWYHQAGTPEVAVSRHFDAEAGVLRLRLRQSTPATPGQPDKAPLHIPIRLGLLAPDGHALPVRLHGASDAPQERVIELRDAERVFEFEGLKDEPVPSLLRHFSAPVRLRIDYRDDELLCLIGHDADAFNRWEAAQRYYMSRIGAALAQDDAGAGIDASGLVDALRQALADPGLDPAFLAELLTPPAETYVAAEADVIDVERIHQACRALRGAMAQGLEPELLERVQRAGRPAGDDRSGPAMGERALRNVALALLSELDTARAASLCMAQYQAADNMTDAIAAVSVLAHLDCEQREAALADFYQRWHDDALVLDKWFSVQALSRLPGTLDRVRALLDDPAFSRRNPNKVRALIGAFAHSNPLRFNAPDGSGYAFVVEQVLALDALNPQVAARLLGAFSQWRRHEPGRREGMRQALEQVAVHDGLSRDVQEVVGRTLAA